MDLQRIGAGGTCCLSGFFAPQNGKYGAAKMSYPILKNESGTTLIEVVAVLLIASVLFAMAVTRFNDNTAAVQRRNAARLIVRDLQYAQEMAVTHGRAVKVEVQTSQNRYLVKWAKTGELLKRPDGGGPFIRQFGKDQFLHVAISGTDLATGSFLFATSGRPLVGANPLSGVKTAIRLNSTYQIVVLPHTGRIKLLQNGGGN